MDDTLVCWDCGRRVAPPAVRCDCGEPLWFEFGPESVGTPGDHGSMWERGAPLPASAPAGFPESVGGTPLVRVSSLDTATGCRLSLKDETRNPTGTFKDRGSAVGVARAAESSSSAVGTVSHGNMAISVAAHAAALDQEAVILVPDDIPPVRLAHIARFDPTVLRVTGEYGSLYARTLKIGPEVGIDFLNSDVPTRVAGQKTLVYEVVGTLGHAPDAVVLPVSSGGNASAVWKAFRELQGAGAITEIPRLYFVQAAACDPIARAFRNGEETVQPTVAADTIAYSIANPDPPSGNRALAAARDSGGAVLSVGDAAIRKAQSTIATHTGLAVEPASATTVAGICRLTDDETLSTEDHVVAVATGTGYREEPDGTPDSSVVSLDDLEATLSSL